MTSWGLANDVRRHTASTAVVSDFSLVAGRPSTAKR
jgi:hypothetical protein